MDKDTLICVIVPVYQVEQYLAKCIESILLQTYSNFELILVDDGSMDASGKICDAYATQDTRIQVIHQNNGGLSAARNSGLRQAHGDYIVFVDSDDYIRETMLEHLYQGLTQSHADIAICGIQMVDELGIPINKEETLSRKMIWNESSFWNFYYMDNHWMSVSWNKLYKKNLFDSIRFPEGKIYEDDFILHEIIARCKVICGIPSVEYFYVHRRGSIMHSSFSARNLLRPEALLCRVQYFWDTEQYIFAQEALLGLFSTMAVIYPDVKNLSLETKQVYLNLRREVNCFFHRLVHKKPMLKFLLRGMLFSIHPELYRSIRGVIR